MLKNTGDPMDAMELAKQAKKQNIIDIEVACIAMKERRGSWQSVIVIALKSDRRSLSERRKRRKSWTAGKERRKRV